MADRTCPSCGADVSSASGFCPRCGADLEARLIELGGAAPARSGREPRRARPRRTRLLAGLAAVVVGGLAVTSLVADDGGDGGGEDDTPDGEEADGTTTTLGDLRDRAPLLGEATGLVVAIRGQSRVLVDLDEGRITDVGPFDPASASEDAFVSTSDLGVQLWEQPFDEASAVLLDELGATDALVGSTLVWAFVLSEGRALRRDGAGVASTVQLPSGADPVGTVGDALIVTAPGGTFAIGPDGATDLVSTGTAIATGHDLLAVAVCDDRLACVVQTTDLDGTVLQTVPLTGVGHVMAASIGPDGHVAWISAAPGGGLVHVDGRERFPLPAAGAPTLDWSPDGRWLVGSFGRDDLWALDSRGGPDAVPISVDLGRNVYPEQVFVLAGDPP